MLNLSRAGRVVLIDPRLNEAKGDQAEGRIRRIRQNSQVETTHLRGNKSWDAFMIYLQDNEDVEISSEG